MTWFIVKDKTFKLHIRHKAEFFSKKNKKSSTKTQKQKFILTLRLA